MSDVYTTKEFNESKEWIYNSIPNCVADLAIVINEYVAVDIRWVTKGTKLWNNQNKSYFIITNIRAFSVEEWRNSNRFTTTGSSIWTVYCRYCFSVVAGAHNQHQ